MIVKAPRGPNGEKGAWIPVQIVGFDEKENRKIIAIHHDLCTNPAIPGDRDPARSHRITVNEDQPEIPDEQGRFRFRRSSASTEG